MKQYEKYKDSGIEWIGEIPEGWSVKRIKNICSSNTMALSDKTDKNYVFSYVDIGSVTYENGIISSETFSFGNAPSRARRLVKYNDIIVSTVRTYLRAIDIIDTDDKVNSVYSTGFAILTSKSSVIPKFLIHLCRSEYFTHQVSIFSNGINYPSINSCSLNRIMVIIPPLSEQQQIADYLDRKCGEIDELVSLQEKMIEELKSYEQSVITETVTKGLDPNVPLRDSGIEWIGQMPEHWEVEKIKNRIKFNPSISLINIEAETIVSYMPMECLRNGVIAPKTNMYKNVSTYTPFANNDIVLAKVTPCFENGNIAIAKNLANEIGFGTSEIFVIRCNDNIEKEYLFYYLQSSYIKYLGISSMYGTGGLKRVNPIVLCNSCLLCPPLHEQQQIADYLDRKCEEIDKLIGLKQEKIKELKDYKKSTIFEYVTGKKRVTN